MFRYREVKQDSLVNPDVQAKIRALLDDYQKMEASLKVVREKSTSSLVDCYNIKIKLDKLKQVIDGMRFLKVRVNPAITHHAYFLQNLANLVAEKSQVNSVAVCLDRLTRKVEVELVVSIRDWQAKQKISAFKKFANAHIVCTFVADERITYPIGLVVRGLLRFDYAMTTKLLNACLSLDRKPLSPASPTLSSF